MSGLSNEPPNPDPRAEPIRLGMSIPKVDWFMSQ